MGWNDHMFEYGGTEFMEDSTEDIFPAEPDFEQERCDYCDGPISPRSGLCLNRCTELPDDELCIEEEFAHPDDLDSDGHLL